MSDIRVTYSGLISFIISIIAVFTGLVFILILTRRLTPEEFGTWSLLWSIVGYFLISERIISFWTTRQIARNEDVGKTSIVSSSFFSFGTIPLYIAFVFLISQQSNASLEPLVLGAILLPVVFVSEALHSINLGHKPHATGYGLLGYEAFKIPAALVFVYFLDLNINGAIIAITIAYIGTIIIQSYFAKSKIKGTFNIRTLRRWLRLSWIPFYSNIAKVLKSTDIVIYSVITGSVIGIAYYSVALMIAKIIRGSGNISKALYPKLISKGSQTYIPENLSLQLYFAIPMLGIFVIFAKPAMFALNPVYLDAFIIAIILAFRVFAAEFGAFFGRVLKGIDTTDIEERPKFSALIKSKIFFVNTIQNIHTALQLGILIPLIYILNSHGLSELEMVMWWAILALSLEIPFVIIFLLQVRKHVKFSFPIINIGKYTGSTLAFVGIFFLTSDSLIQYHISIFEFLPGVIIQLALCSGIYLLITFVIDQKTRILFKSIILEIKSKK